MHQAFPPRGLVVDAPGSGAPPLLRRLDYGVLPPDFRRLDYGYTAVLPTTFRRLDYGEELGLPTIVNEESSGDNRRVVFYGLL